MKILYFDNELNSETIKELIEMVEENPDSILYFTSGGGDISAIDPVCHALEENNITLIAVSRIYSCGFMIYLLFNGMKRLSLSGCAGMLHIPRVRNLKGCNKSFKLFVKNEYHKSNIEWTRRLGKLAKLNENEMKLLIDEQQEVFFTPERMKEIFGG